MIDIAFFNKALKSVWLRKYLDESNKGKWNFFLMLSLKTFEAKLFLGAPEHSSQQEHGSLPGFEHLLDFVSSVFQMHQHSPGK